MTRHRLSATVLVCGLLAFSGEANTAQSAVPDPFQRFDDTSRYTIKYDDLTALLKTVVVNMGRSTREVVQPVKAKTGTRMKPKVNRLTAGEGNRFYYESFKKNEAGRQLLRDIQENLQQVPSEAPLEYFSRDEQLAYWLNLYNVTILNEIIAVYPIRHLKKMFQGKDSILSKKLLTVSGVRLSLNDIQFTILKQNYDNNPLIMYGLYQGIVGGPNIRRTAYTGNDVYRALKNNALEFVNSNRGTFSKNENIFRVSNLYGRNKVYFPDFESDLTRHLLEYLEGYERNELQEASILAPDISDWTVTDLGGTYQRIGGSFADNNAALMDSMKSTANNGTTPAAVGHGSSWMASKGKPMSRFEPGLLAQLHEVNAKRLNENTRNATVTIEELGEFPTEPTPEIDTDKDEK